MKLFKGVTKINVESLYRKKGKFNLIDIALCYFLIVAGNFMITKYGSYSRTYVFFVLFLFLFLILTRGKLIYPKHYIALIPFAFLSIWIYGFIVGIIRGNEISYILSNFVGILMYVLFYCFYSLNVPIKKIINLLLIVSGTVIVLTLMAYIDMYVLKNMFFLKIPILKDFQMANTIEYASRELIYIAYLYFLYKILFMKQYKLGYIVMVLFAWIAELKCIQSGGDTLAICVLTGILCVLWAYKKWDKRLFYCVVILGVIVAVLLLVMPQSPILVLFSAEDAGNSIRYRQIEVLLSDISLWGHGLGASFGGKIGNAYAIEVIYLNIFHKFGVLAIFMILAYAYTVLAAIGIILKTEDDAKAVIPLACMGYLIPSLANPMLFAPPHVLVHCVALLLICERKKSNENLIGRNEFL